MGNARRRSWCVPFYFTVDDEKYQRSYVRYLCYRPAIKLNNELRLNSLSCFYGFRRLMEVVHYVWCVGNQPRNSTFPKWADAREKWRMANSGTSQGYHVPRVMVMRIHQMQRQMQMHMVSKLLGSLAELGQLGIVRQNCRPRTLGASRVVSGGGRWQAIAIRNKQVVFVTSPRNQ
jgi:hypothetical protein